MGKAWFTSDPHFGHENIIRLCGRPFNSIGEMNEALVANYNAVVRPEDTLYILGDAAYKGKSDDLIRCINGRKVLIEGNHDGKYDPDLFDEVHQILELSLGVGGRNHRLVLCHYPFAEWPGFFRGSIHLHGHQHNKPEYNLEQKTAGLLRYDVGVDANGFMPVDAKHIVRFFGLE